ncbi:MAG: AbrB/MazE/SpoVT family DNA-binding domain-containing protein [Bacilli bacterium]|nr:AbrB/MazE/SpoVT family DNA-binding domain-containing protein [Bacilli bacterium]
MKTTGMVRRVDSLGRIVIPKEIRKVLKIKENEQVEINVQGEEIILNRYSELDESDNALKNLLDIISDVYKVDILLTNLNNFKIVSKNYQYLVCKELSPYLSNILDERREVIKQTKINLLLSSENVIDSTYLIKTIIINGDTVGLIIFLSDNYQNIDTKLVDLMNHYLEKYLE